ncbi:MAG: nitroreductase family protein [Chloroflexota bacterium]|nr:nitroreductase family protein [Chloroflexota bacterium]
MTNQPATPAALVRPLLHVRQVRDFTDQAVDSAALSAVADAARWSGSAGNRQPWRFVVVRRPETLRRLADSNLPSTHALTTATAALAIAEVQEQGAAVSIAFDEGRAAERALIAASLLGLGAAIVWIAPDARPAVHAVLGVPDDRFVRTIVAIGHPTAEARRPKAARGTARLPRRETVFREQFGRR